MKVERTLPVGKIVKVFLGGSELYRAVVIVSEIERVRVRDMDGTDTGPTHLFTLRDNGKWLERGKSGVEARRLYLTDRMAEL